MANWAYTNYVIEGPKETLNKIHEALMHPSLNDDEGDGWEGGVLRCLGINPDGEWYLRGFIESEPQFEDDVIRFEAMEAWGVTDFHNALEENFPEIKVYFSTMEEDNCVFETNDKDGVYFSSRFYVDMCYKNDYYSEFFDDEKDALAYISEITDGKIKDEKDIYKFNEELNEDTDEFISLYSYTII